MRRRTPCLALLLLALLGAREVSAQTPPTVGRFIGLVQRVTLSGAPAAQRLSPIVLGMEVATDGTGRADVALQRVREGKLVLGPDTAVAFDEGVAAGRPVLTLRQRIGLLRLVMMPQGKRPGAGQYWIETEHGTVRMLGTDVYVRTDRWGMAVAVVEGRVEVESRGGRTVEVGAGEWTWVAAGQPPTPPAPVERGPGAAGSPASSGSPGDAILIDPPGLTPERLDLPR